MQIKTFGELRNEVELELDLQNEDIIKPDEMVIFTNDGLTDVESIIMGFNEDYFLAPPQDINLVAGKSLYSLPLTIYANKIRGILYTGLNYNDIYEIKPYKPASSMNMLLDLSRDASPPNSSTQPLKYILRNDPNQGFKIEFIPTPQVTGKFAKIWFIRECAKIPLVSAGTQAASDATNLDIPQFYPFLKAFVCAKCVSKEGHPRYEQIIAEFKYQREQMMNVLRTRQLDNNDQMAFDLGHYQDHV